MKAWLASPYRGIGIYVSGTNRACKQAELTAAWVADVSAMGWKLLPISMGLQAPCRDNTKKKPMDASKADSQAVTDAKAAVAAAKKLGIAPGSPLFADIESYDSRKSSCVKAVAKYISAWTIEVHRSGYLSGVYGNLGSGVGDLSDRYASTSYARPDAVWLARWDSKTSLTGWDGIPDAQWAHHQRAKQYRGDHNEKHGGVTLNIDSDYVDGPVATVAKEFPIKGVTRLRTRQTPSSTAKQVGIREPSESVWVLCHTRGENVAGTTWWNKLSDGSYVSDAYVGAKGLRTCRYPVQVAPAKGTVPVSVPGPTGVPAKKTLPAGALAWVTCQTPGPLVGGTTVWNRLDDGTYVSNSVLASTSNAAFAPGVTRC